MPISKVVIKSIIILSNKITDDFHSYAVPPVKESLPLTVRPGAKQTTVNSSESQNLTDSFQFPVIPDEEESSSNGSSTPPQQVNGSECCTMTTCIPFTRKCIVCLYHGLGAYVHVPHFTFNTSV